MLIASAALVAALPDVNIGLVANACALLLVGVSVTVALVQPVAVPEA
jgi:hypothetical protein